jgi:Domain of unknown function (DUF4328)
MSSVTSVAVRPLRTPAVLCVVALWVLAVLSLVRAAATPLVFAAIDRVDRSRGLAGLLDEPVLLAFNVMMMVYVAGAIFTEVAFIVWLYQARRNLDRRGETGMRWGRGWTIGAWFIPLANAVIPALVVGEVFDRSMPEAVRSRRMSRLVTAWWVALLLSSNVRIDWHGVVQITGGRFWNVINGLAGCVAAVLAVQLIRRVTARQAAWA